MILGMYGKTKIVASGGTISFISSTAAVESSTDINTQTTMSGIQNGDCLLAFVMYRGNGTLGIPAGWTIISTIKCNGYDQWLSIVKKDTVTSANSSTAYTFTQSNYSRFILSYSLARSSTGTVVIKEVKTETNYSLGVPLMTPTGNELLIVGITGLYMFDGNLTSPTGWTTDAGNGDRLTVKHLSVTNGQSYNRTPVPTNGGNSYTVINLVRLGT